MFFSFVSMLWKSYFSFSCTDKDFFLSVFSQISLKINPKRIKLNIHEDFV